MATGRAWRRRSRSGRSGAGQPAGSPAARARSTCRKTRQLFGTALPSVVKATAIVNGEVITQTDIDQRLALLAIANGGQIPADEIERLAPAGAAQPDRRDAADPGRQGAQRSRSPTADIDKTVARVAGNVEADARADGRLSEGQRLLDPLDPPPDRGRNRLAPAAARQDRERRQRRRRRSAGGHRPAERVEGHRGISASAKSSCRRPRTIEPQAQANASKIFEQLQAGRVVRRLCPPVLRSVDRRGRRRPRLGPARAASRAACRRRCARCGRAQVSNPITVPGGYSIVAVQDKRKILTADPRNAVLSLKQVSVGFPTGTTAPQAEPIVARFAQAAQNIGGCGGAETHRRRLQRRGRPVGPGQAARTAAGAAGNDAADAGRPGDAAVRLARGRRPRPGPVRPRRGRSRARRASTRSMPQMNEERVNMRARRYLRDLRRDAVIDYR